MQPQDPFLLQLEDDPYLTLDAARQLYAQGDTAHDMDHILRVTTMAIRLAHAEGADARIVRLAALLHDVPTTTAQLSPSDFLSDAPQAYADSNTQSVEDASAAERVEIRAAERLDHHHAAAAFARQLLGARGLGTVLIEQVVHCIEAHRFRDRSIQDRKSVV